MIKSSRIWIYSLALLSMILILTNSCTKSLTDITAPATVTDVDGNVYHTVKIGTQVWMLENLRTTKYRSGKPTPERYRYHVVESTVNRGLTAATTTTAVNTAGFWSFIQLPGNGQCGSQG